MYKIRLIHWNQAEAMEKAELLTGMGFEVDSRLFIGPPDLKTMRENPPDAVIIDLNRLPSQGRDLALSIRTYKSTRNTAIIFVEGVSAKVERIKGILPDAVYTCWGDIENSVTNAIENIPISPVVPYSIMAGYSGTPLPKKLGIKPRTLVDMINAPADFEKTLGALPEGVILRRHSCDGSDVTLWFVTNSEELQCRINRYIDCAKNGYLWIIWPKKGSGIESDLSQNVVRETGLSLGLVDFKVCAVDETWSGLLFTARKGKGETY